MKYKVGDWIVVKKFDHENDERHIKIGQEYEIINVNDDDYTISTGSAIGEYWWIDFDCCELVYGYQSPLWKVLNGEEI